MPSLTAEACSAPSQAVGRDPSAYGKSSHQRCCLLHPLLQSTPRAPICHSGPQSDWKADWAASTGRDRWTPVQGPSDDCHPCTRASSLCSPLLHTQVESTKGNVYRDASLQLQFTSSLTVSLQRSFFFFLIGTLISNEFSLFFIEIPKQLWHILFVLLKTGKWRSLGEIKKQLMIY